MKNSSDVAVIVVTYNRKKLLKENILALQKQNYKKIDIYIIDNASTDGTKEYISNLLNKNTFYENTGKNLGGAGGFHYGMKKIQKKKYQYAWLMDDDTIVTKNSLVSLMNSAKLLKNDFSFLGSLVKWKDEHLCIMNAQTISKKWYENYQYMSQGIIPIQNNSFVAFFVNMKKVEKVGLPIKEFFIYGDDLEYSERLLKESTGYLDINSVVIHKMNENSGADIIYVDSNKINRYYYNYRNLLYIKRRYHCFYERVFFFLKILYTTFAIIKNAPNKKLQRIFIMWKGTIAGIFFNPKIDK